MAPASLPRHDRRAAQLLGLGVAAAIALAAVAAHGAWRAAERHRRAAEAAVHSQVTLLAAAIANSVQVQAWFAIRTLLKASHDAATAGPLPDLQRLVARAEREAIGPGFTLLAPTRAFTVSADGRWTTVGRPLDGATRTARQTLLAERIRRGAADGVSWGPGVSGPGTTVAARFLYLVADAGEQATLLVAAPLDAQGRWHGFEVPLAQFQARILAGVARSYAVAVPGDSSATLRLRITSPAGEQLYQSDPPPAPPYLAEAHMGGSLAALVEVSLPPGAAERLVDGGLPTSPRAWILGGFLLLTLLILGIGVAAWRTWRLGRQQADFASSVTHELRTPLTQIQLFAETLQLDRARSPEARRGALEAIVRETRRLVQMLENVLAVSRVGRPSERLYFREERIDLLLQEVMAGFGPLLRQRGITPVVDAATPLPFPADGEALRRILINLVDNAIRHAPGGRAITVRAAREGDGLRLSVEDEGAGVPEGDLARLWRPFERGAATGGSGLGLAVVRRLVDLHGGAVRVERGAARGARFVVTLPRPAAGAAA